MKQYVLRLFITGTSYSSGRALENIRSILDNDSESKYELEVIDLREHPECAKSEQIFVSPVLIKKLPAPIRRFVGDLSDKDKILVGLGLILKESKTHDTKTERKPFPGN